MERTAKIMAVLGLVVLCSSALAVDGNEPIAHWKFDEGSGTTAYDSAGDNHGTVYGAVWTAGQIDGALSFDGVNDYVDCGNSFESVTGSATKSIMVWVNSDTTNYTTCGLILELYRKSDSSSGFYIKTCDNPATWQSFHRTSGSYTILDSGVYVTDEWTQVALVQNGPKVDLYVNGVSEASASDGVAPSTSSPLNASIGAYIYQSTASACFKGSIDEVRIYDRALTAEEIKQVYVDGLSSFERATIYIEDAIAEKEEMLDVIDETLEKEDKAYDALEELLESKDYGDLKKGDIVTAKQKIHSAAQHQEQSFDTLEKSIERLYDALAALGWEPEPEPPEPNEPELEPNLISHWKFDETSGTTAYDSVGDNDGTVYGAVWTIGQIDGALSFDGANDYVRVPDDESLDSGTGSFSIAAWIKIGGSLPPGYSQHTIVAKRKPTGNKNQFQFAVVDSSIVERKLRLLTHEGSTSKIDGVTTINDSIWYHVVGVRNSNGIMEVYVNGVLDNSTSLPVRDVDNDAFLAIGTNSTQGLNYFNGTIDDVRIYDRALSAAEIQQLYQDGL